MAITENSCALNLQKIKAIDFSQWTSTFWLVKRSIVQRDAKYSIIRVNIDNNLQKRFQGYIETQLQNKDFHITEYDFNNADGDDTLFTIDTDTTDFKIIASLIDKGFDIPHATAYDELLNSWAYVVMFENVSDRLFAWRKINAMTQPKKALSQKAIFFRDHALVDVEDREVFLIDPRFDFFVYSNTTFIANKKEFESSMNFREGMKAHAAEVVQEFDDLKFAENITIISEHVGDNMHHLRKLASIRKAGYYKQPGYIERMIQVSAEEGWDLKVVDGKIIVEKETVELLMKLLNNDRLRSPINGDLFDSAAKSRVSKTSNAA